MDKTAAFNMIREALTMPEPQSTQYADRTRFATDKAAYDAKLKGCAVGALIILEETLRDFKIIADALKAMSERSTITYAGPLHFQICGNVASTFDPKEQNSG